MNRSRTLLARNRLPVAGGALMLWVVLAPWIWGFANSRPAVANHIFSLMALGPLTLMVAVLRPAAFVALAGGIWLALSPWVLGYATNHAAWLNEFVSGGLRVVLCANAAGVSGLISARRHSERGRTEAPASATLEPAGSRS